MNERKRVEHILKKAGFKKRIAVSSIFGIGGINFAPRLADHLGLKLHSTYSKLLHCIQMSYEHPNKRMFYLTQLIEECYDNEHKFGVFDCTIEEILMVYVNTRLREYPDEIKLLNQFVKLLKRKKQRKIHLFIKFKMSKDKIIEVMDKRDEAIAESNVEFANTYINKFWKSSFVKSSKMTYMIDGDDFENITHSELLWIEQEYFVPYYRRLANKHIPYVNG